MTLQNSASADAASGHSGGPAAPPHHVGADGGVVKAWFIAAWGGDLMGWMSRIVPGMTLPAAASGRRRCDAIGRLLQVPIATTARAKDSGGRISSASPFVSSAAQWERLADDASRSGPTGREDLTWFPRTIEHNAPLSVPACGLQAGRQTVAVAVAAELADKVTRRET
jgi:hypothetical protein